MNAARAILETAIAHRVFPAAVAEVGSSQGPMWHEALGRVTFHQDAAAARVETLFDLASLTKPLATGMLVMQLVQDGALGLDEPVASLVAEWRAADRESVTVADLLAHASGLPARLFDQPPGGRREFEHEICAIKLHHESRSQALYSDLGFILLGFIVEDRGGLGLRGLFESLVERFQLDPRTLTFNPVPDARRGAAPTRPTDDDVRRGRTLVGEVHDNYAAALGGAAGHAGLFGTARSVGVLARRWLQAARGIAGPEPLGPPLVRQFISRTSVPGSSRALAWDTMLPTSSCGTRMTSSAFGHVGFTGTSLWIDPGRDRYFVLLTNRAFGDGSIDDMKAVRREFHDALGNV